MTVLISLTAGLFAGMAAGCFGEYIDPSTPEQLWNGGWFSLFAGGLVLLVLFATRPPAHLAKEKGE